MPEGEGAFDGGGSVRWEVKNLKDDGPKFSTGSDGNGNVGRKTKGADKADGEIFKIVLKVPSGDDGTTFLKQFSPTFLEQFGEDPNEIVLELKREKRDKQIKVQWPETEIGSQTGS